MFLFVGLGLIAKRALPSFGLDLARERVVDVHVVVVLQVVVVVGALPTRGTGCTALAREPKPASKPRTRDAPCSSRSCTCSRTMTRRSSIGKPSTLGPCFQPEGINALGIGQGHRQVVHRRTGAASHTASSCGPCPRRRSRRLPLRLQTRPCALGGSRWSSQRGCWTGPGGT